ncbi:nuclear transport factor 2 family protein [Phenylobacterium sp.]|jgi:ketosteroid isomerase-like protein|uniref:nuclear transport factor 2 family protein n=1 Tax=Phenylobacterium sp. TaxID=1871053 RepID=UPI002F3FB48A
MRFKRAFRATPMLALTAAALIAAAGQARAQPDGAPASSRKEAPMSDEAQQSVARAVLEADDRRRAATMAGDADALEALLTPDFTYTHNTGFREGRAAYVARVRNRQVEYVSMERLFAGVRVHGGVALVDGLASMTNRAPPAGPLRTSKTLYLAVWVLSNGQWRMAAYASTLARSD